MARPAAMPREWYIPEGAAEVRPLDCDAAAYARHDRLPDLLSAAVVNEITAEPDLWADDVRIARYALACEVRGQADAVPCVVCGEPVAPDAALRIDGRPCCSTLCAAAAVRAVQAAVRRPLSRVEEP